MYILRCQLHNSIVPVLRAVSEWSDMLSYTHLIHDKCMGRDIVLLSLHFSLARIWKKVEENKGVFSNGAGTGNKVNF